MLYVLVKFIFKIIPQIVLYGKNKRGVNKYGILRAKYKGKYVQTYMVSQICIWLVIVIFHQSKCSIMEININTLK